MQKPSLLVIVGPTASGKTALAVECAKEFNGEIISADSMQIYKGMSIATAKPTVSEMQGIPASVTMAPFSPASSLPMTTWPFSRILWSW